MSIWQGDGTTNYEVGKVYEGDGTTNYQIGKVYEGDGTTNNLIYTAAEPDTPMILNYSDEVTAVTGGWKLGNKGGYAYTQGWSSDDNAWVMRYSGNNWSGAGFMQTINKFNISGYSTLRLSLKTVRGYGDATKGSGYVYIAIVPNASGSGNNASGYCGGKPDNKTANAYDNNNPAVAYIQSWYGDNSGTTLDLDVSAINGSYYIQIGRYNETGYATFTSHFYSLTFIE
jgi:hypothetical protein